MKVKELAKFLDQFDSEEEIKVSAIVDFNSFDEDYIEMGYAIIDADILDVDVYDEEPVLMVQDNNFKGGNILE